MEKSLKLQSYLLEELTNHAVAPVGPCIPWRPVAPVGPVTPWIPCKPCGPVAPVHPVNSEKNKKSIENKGKETHFLYTKIA